MIDLRTIGWNETLSESVAARVDAYHQLERENQHLAAKQDQALAARTKERWKRIHREARRFEKTPKGRRGQWW